MSVNLLSLNTNFSFWIIFKYLQSMYTTGKENKMESEQKTEEAIPSWP